MMRHASQTFGVSSLLFVGTFFSVIFFPWPLTALLAVITAFFIPLAPFAIGLFADALYYVPSHGFPIFTIWGAVVTGVALFVHKQLRASIILR